MYAFSQRNAVSKPCPGVLINGVCWARSNVDEPGTFAATPEAIGMYYQWNRKKGWPAEKPGMEWFNAGISGEHWEAENDPCPKGWRVPTVEEMKISLTSGEVASIYTQRNGVEGVEFTDMSTRAAVFFPLSNPLTYNGPDPGETGTYWSGSSSGDRFAESLMFYEYDQLLLYQPFIKNEFGFTVRCVADENVPACADVVTDTYVSICANDLPYEWGDTTFDVGTESGVYRFQHISAVTGCDSIVNLHLTVDECEKPCPGVLINDVCWAEYNVDEPGRFANPGKPYGMLYQWNRKKGWPAMTPDSVAGWDSSLEPGDMWEPANDPCPTGWRMPTAEEMEKLFDKTKVSSIETARDRVLSTRYTDIATGNMIFLPHANYRDEHGVTRITLRKEYWSGSNHWALWDDHIFQRQPYAHGYSVRCVADENACDIVLTASETICKEALPYAWHDTTFRRGTVTGEYCIRRTNPASGCDSIFYLYLTVDTLCGKPCKERGVFINGVCWAESNVDTPNTFADTPEAFGLLYQWNWKKGHPLKGDIDWEDWGKHYSDAHWEAVNNPCPADWRIPNIGEIYTLLDDLNVTHEWTQQNGVNGMRFTDKTNGNTIFMPAAGHRLYPFDVSGSDSGGNYWSTTREYSNKATYELCFSKKLIHTFPLSGNGASSVRCVAGRDTTGCGSIVTDTFLTVCTNDLPYEWGDTIFDVGTESGTYSFQYVSTVTGNDSLVNLHLTIQQPFDTTFYDTVCQGTSYNRHGFSLSDVRRDDVYTLSLSSRAGCDSTLTLHLKVHPVYATTLYDTICQGDDYTNHGFNLPAGTAGGTFTETYTTVHGCDSVVTLHLHVHPSHFFSETQHICQGDTITFHDRQLYKSGVYYDSLTTVHGCDSIYSMTLTVHSTSPLLIPDAVCSGSSYNNHGFHLPAVYHDTLVRDTFRTVWGCDSIRILSLSVHPVYETPLYDTICQGDDYNRHGFSLSNVQTDEEYTLSLSSRVGCDSTLILHLKVHPVYATTLYDSICPLDHYERYGFRLSNLHESGTYRRTLPTVHGCDSTVTLHLHVWPTYFNPETVHLCEGDTFDFRGRRYHESGIYYDSLSTSTGCDSVYCLYLSVHPVYDLHLSGVLCEGSPYTQNGFHATTPGMHYRYLQSTFGCDSTITLTLTEEKKITGAISLLLEDCSLHGYSFFFEPGDQISRYQWDLGDGTILRTEEGYHQYADSGTYRIQLHTETYNDCENHFTYIQYVPPYLKDVPIHSDRQVIDEDYPTVRFHAVVLPGMTCRWDFGDGVTATGDSVSHTYNATTEPYYDVTLQVLNADSCVTESGLRIEVVFLPKTTNTFSPNGDGINDIFMPDYRIEIIDRNGLRIFTGESGWDGTYKGSPAKEDTYFYLLHYRTANGERQKTGYVTLIR